METMLANSFKKEVSRRQFLRGSAMLGLAGALAACAPSAAPSSGAAESSSSAGAEAAPAKEGIVISHWAFWNQLGNVKEAFEKTDELKQALGSNTWEFRTGIEREVWLTALAGGTPPDIGALYGYYDFMVKGQAIPLDDYVAQSKVISQDKFIEGNWGVCQHDGKLYGIPAYECFLRRGLNYNIKMIEDAGLDANKPPETWDELFDWHEKLTKFDGAGNLQQIGIDPYDAEGGVGPGGDGWFMCESWDVDWFDMNSKEFHLNDERIAKGMEVMGEFVKLIGPDNLAGLRSVEGQGSWGGSFNAGIQAMIIEGYWHPGETVAEKPEIAPFNRATWVPVPEERRGTKIQYGGGHMVQIYKDSKNKDLAFPIAEFLQSTACNDIIFNNIGWLPAYKPYFEGADPNKYPGLDFYFKSINEANYWGKDIRCEIQSFIETKVGEAREKVFRGEMTGQAAADWMQDQAITEWKQAGYG